MHKIELDYTLENERIIAQYWIDNETNRPIFTITIIRFPEANHINQMLTDEAATSAIQEHLNHLIVS